MADSAPQRKIKVFILQLSMDFHLTATANSTPQQKMKICTMWLFYGLSYKKHTEKNNDLRTRPCNYLP